MTKNVKKEMLLLQEYKEGFSEIRKLVDSFEAIEPDSQETFIKERTAILEQQLGFIQEQRMEVCYEARSFLAKINSRLKALLDTESYLKGQLEECAELGRVIAAAKDKTASGEG